MANNDPAFLFYPKDWLQGTAQMSPEEKGVYIDLLAHQHQENGLPNDTNRLCRMAHLSHEDFLKIWQFLKEKFKEIDGKLFNKKLVSVINDRSEHSEMRRIIGTFGKLLTELNLDYPIREKIRKSFSYIKFIGIDKQKLSKTLAEWLAIAQATHEDGNAIEDAIGNTNTNGNKEGSTRGEKYLVPKMCTLWYSSFPKYTSERDNDLAGMGKILWFIAKQSHLKQVADTETQGKILNTLQLIADQVNREPFWVNKPLKSIANHMQEFYNKIKNPQENGNGKSNSSKVTGEQLNSSFAKFHQKG